MYSKRNLTKISLSNEIQHGNKNNRDGHKTSMKSRGKKSCDLTSTTLPSRKSMDGKPTKRKLDSTSQTKVKQITKAERKSFENQYSRNSEVKLKIPLQENKKITKYDDVRDGSVSFREYCMIGDNWVPILSSSQRERVTNPVSLKQSTKLDIKKGKPSEQQPTISALEYLKLQVESDIIDWDKMNEQTKIYYRKVMKTVMKRLNCLSTPLRKTSFNEKQVVIDQLSLEKSMIRMSQATSFKEQKQINKQSNNEQNIQYMLQNKQNIESKSEISQINNSLNEIQCNSKENSPVKNYYEEQVTPNMCQVTVQDKIKFRQMRQMGILPRNSSFQLRLQSETNQNQKDSGIFTDVFELHEYMDMIMEAINIQNLQKQVLYNLKMAWGCSKMQKINRIRKGKYLGSLSTVLSQSIFQSVQDRIGKNCFYSFIHNKCLFDCINSELNKLKPFYDCNGEIFPWTFRLCSPLTFIELDEESLPVALDEVKGRIMYTLSFLCGLIVDVDQQNPDFMLLAKKKSQRDDNLCKYYINHPQNQAHQESKVEHEAMLVLEDVSDFIFQQLLSEIQNFL